MDDDAARALATQVASAVAAGDVSGLPVAGAGAAALQKDTAAALKGLGTSKRDRDREERAAHRRHRERDARRDPDAARRGDLAATTCRSP